MNEEIQESIEFSYTSNSKNFNLSINRRGKERWDAKEIMTEFETFLVACGLAEPKSYLNSKDLAEKLRTEHELKSKKTKKLNTDVESSKTGTN